MTILNDRKSLSIAFWTKNQFWWHFSPYQINTQLLISLTFFTKFWMTENHFWSHFSPFQINAQLYFLWIFYKMATGGILDDRKSLLIAFLAILDQYATFNFFDFFFHKMAVGSHFGWPKIIFDRISRHFRSTRSFSIFFYFFLFFTKWPPAAILDDRKITFLAISDQYATFFFLIFFSKWLPAAILDSDFCQNDTDLPL